VAKKNSGVDRALLLICRVVCYPCVFSRAYSAVGLFRDSQKDNRSGC
jgi:hypothetical protein